MDNNFTIFKYWSGFLNITKAKEITAYLLTSSATSVTAKFNNLLMALLFPDPTYAIPKAIQAPYLMLESLLIANSSIKVSAACSFAKTIMAKARDIALTILSLSVS